MAETTQTSVAGGYRANPFQKLASAHRHVTHHWHRVSCYCISLHHAYLATDDHHDGSQLAGSDRCSLGRSQRHARLREMAHTGGIPHCRFPSGLRLAIGSFEKLKFVDGVFRNLSFIREKLDFEFVMVSNQDGLGTASFPEDTFWPVHNFILQTLAGEGITFDDILIDPHFPEDNAPTRKPNIGLVEKYINNPDYNIANSYVIGDRETDRIFARNIGCKSLILSDEHITWNKISEILFAGERIAEVSRKTKETDIHIKVNLDGTGKCDIQTGLGFFDHMLEQIGKHGMMDLTIHTKGDLEVDEHHTIEDTAIALGECILQALGNKRGIERYGYCLPMDDCLCSVALDFGGRPWLVWDAEFKREKIGEMPTEMFLHFFKSLSDASKMNLNIKAEGQNEHHKIEGIFKALARALKMAVRRDIYHFELPSTKGML